MKKHTLVFTGFIASIILTLILVSCQTTSENSNTNIMDNDKPQTVKSQTEAILPSAMSSKVAKLYDDYMSAWKRGDHDAAMEFWSDDIVMYAPGSNPHSGIYHGIEEVQRNLMDRIYEETATAEVLGIVDRAIGNDHVFTIVHERFTKADGRVFETKRIIIYRWLNQKIIEVRYFDLDQKAADAFWSD